MVVIYAFMRAKGNDLPETPNDNKTGLEEVCDNKILRMETHAPLQYQEFEECKCDYCDGRDLNCPDYVIDGHKKVQ